MDHAVSLYVIVEAINHSFKGYVTLQQYIQTNAPCSSLGCFLKSHTHTHTVCGKKKVNMDIDRERETETFLVRVSSVVL